MTDWGCSDSNWHYEQLIEADPHCNMIDCTCYFCGKPHRFMR